ncbi:ATPase, T2SS/T4P/T4SS family [Oligella urethralis]|uniref:ATPase, T2SS/T4P/T4SS family n=1 Tax=Oligella urethralis TaxID=90245 RepID=UPI00254AFD4A|nr:ATPase, T2SS/T4P/T4SS family [Oligella urethralis]MDK6202097.1 ATPase, T2SS/T4P/T4SS family [Oligella urethralis]
MNRLCLNLQFEDGRCEEMWFDLPLDIGRHSQGLVLKSWRVAKEHAKIEAKDGELYLQDLGSLGGTLLNSQRIHHLHPLKLNDQIVIGPCLIRIVAIDSGQEPGHTVNDASDPQKNRVQTTARPLSKADSATIMPQAVPPSERTSGIVQAPDARTLIAQRNQLHKLLLEALDLKRNNITAMDDALLREEAAKLLNKIIQADKQFSELSYAQELSQMVIDEAVGLGPLEPLLQDPSITEIMVNRFDEIYIERNGKLEAHPMSFSSNQSVISIIDRIVSPIGRRIDESSPMVDARLKDGSRVNAVIPPIAIKGPSITIRKFPHRRPAMADLVALESLDNYMREFLDLCVKHRMNMIISGGTGSGKTTLLNVLSNCIPEGERIVTIEDAAELRLNHRHLISLESRPANTEGRGQVSIRDLVKNALRMRPDRIVVGECRGGEAFDMLGAMNTGHEGSLTTLHANSPRDAIARLEVMILMAGMDIPLSAIREHIASSIDFIVQQTRLSNGRRVVSSIVEVCGLESGIIKIQEIFKFQKGTSSGFYGLGIIPEQFERLKEQGLALDIEQFNQVTLSTTQSAHSLH